MTSKSIIGAALAAIFTLGVTTSCEDMFDIDSSRVIIESEHNLNSTADSAYTTLGILQSMRQIADRYVILGEVRGDLVEINEYTKTSLRNLSEFNFEEDNEYLNVRDYYAVINNCNYALAKIDTTLSHNNERVMVDEYAAILGIRAWTYLQLGINYGKVPYYTNPITTVEESEREYPELDMKGLAAELIPQLIPFVDYDLPVFVNSSNISQNVYPPLQLIVADLYLWSGDYANACATYLDYMTTHPHFNLQYGPAGNAEIFRGYMGLNGSALLFIRSGNITGTAEMNWDPYLYYSSTTSAIGYENLAYITMESSSAQGTVSEVGSLFVSTDNTHPLNPSTYWQQLNKNQAYFTMGKTADGSETTEYTVNTQVGDQRGKYYWKEPMITTEANNSFEVYDKLTAYSIPDGANIECTTQQINIYRRSIVYLRAAEALNALANETQNDSLAVMSFNLLKDAYKVFFPNGHFLESDLRPAFIGVHARGCGDVRLDTVNYTLKPEAIALRLYNNPEQAVNFNDTINYIDELIIDELALEASLEGNRFGDLIRFAERRGEPEFLAKRVASRKGEGEMDNDLYNKLLDKTLWYLPLK